ncbi:MAG: zinc ribbon domain-containing protein [Eubacteriaceae bacterium]
MYCSKCGSQLNENSKFCDACGNTNNKIDSDNSIFQQPIENRNVSYKSLGNASNFEQTPTSIQNNGDVNCNNNIKVGKDKKGLFALLCGIGSIIFSAVTFLGIVLGIGGIVFSTKEQRKTNKGKVGKVLSIIGIVFAVFFLLGVFILNSGFKMENKTYNGNGYELKYDYSWRIGELSGGQEALINDFYGSSFVPIATSSLSQFSYDFDTESGKKEMYDAFYSMWNSSLSKQSSSLFNGSNGFTVLIGDIYYATIDYGQSSDKINGKYYILISKVDDIVLSFMSNAVGEKVPKTNEEVLKMLKEIKINKSTVVNNSNTVENDDTPEKFTPRTTENFTVLGYMDYTMPECWKYNEKLSEASQYSAYIFNFKDGKNFAEVKAFSPMDMNKFETGTSIEKIRDGINSLGLTIKNETIKTINGVEWYNITTEDYDNENLGGNFYSEYYVALSKSNENVYIFEFYISNTLNANQKKYMSDSIDYAINSAKLLKYEK